MRDPIKNIRFLKLNMVFIGLVGIVCQVIILREAIVFFSGSELSIGITLGAWLFYSSLGSFVFGKLKNRKALLNIYFLCQICVPIFLYVDILLFRASSTIFHIDTGEIIPFLDVLKYSFLLIIPIPFIMGILFPISVSLLRQVASDSNGREAGQIYFYEVVGCVIGGIIATILIIKGLSSFTIGLITLLLPLSSAVLASQVEIEGRKTRIGFMLLIFVIFLISAGYLLYNEKEIESNSRRLSFPDLQFINTVDSPYGNISITQNNELYSFFVNGSLSFSMPDKFASEESVHLAMLQVPNAKEILLVGGGLSGYVDEILIYDIQRLDYIEFDRVLFENAIALFDEDSTSNNPFKDERLNVLHGDAWRFLKTRNESTYDVIIMNLMGPHDAFSNRFFTFEFFYDVNRVLKRNGVFSFGLPSNANYISPEILSVNGTIYHTLKNVFNEVLITPEDFNYFVASKGEVSLTFDAVELGKRLDEIGIKTNYIDMYYLADRLDPLRISILTDSFEGMKNPRINTIDYPHAYFSSLKLSAKTHYLEKGKRNLQLTFSGLILAGIMLFLIFTLSQKNSFSDKSSFMRNISLSLTVAVTGFSMMFFEVLIIYLFQSYCGYVYERIGLVIAFFMIGMAIGSGAGTKVKEVSLRASLLGSLVFLIILLLVMRLSLAELKDFPVAIVEVIFYILAVISGAIGGFQFPIVSMLYLQLVKNKESSSGLIYSYDLMGSVFGAVYPSILMIPILGIVNSIYLVILIVSVCFILLILSNTRRFF